MFDGLQEERTAIRILVADDFTEWRVWVRSLLQARPEWQIVGEARDGLAAVQMTKELLPELSFSILECQS
jgi:chemotaxis response regulator CheB